MYKKLPKVSQSLIASLIAVTILSSCSDSGPIRPENAVIQGINYVGMSVSNLEQSSDFYTNAVNLQIADNKAFSDSIIFKELTKRPEVSVKTRLLKSANAQIRMMQFASPSSNAQNTKHVEVNGPGFAHVCYQANSKMRAYQKFLASGASTIGDPDMVQLSTRNPVHYAYARDHNHTMFEVEHVDVDKLDRTTPPKNNFRIRHVALATPNFERTIKFYSALLEQKKPRILGSFFYLVR